VSQSLEWLAPERTGISSIFFSPQKTSVSSIELDTVREVCKGVKTDVLLKAGLVDPNCCLSIITSERSLDLTFASATERDNVLRGLRFILQDVSNPVRFT
jgi:hypothetical protein